MATVKDTGDDNQSAFVNLPEQGDKINGVESDKSDTMEQLNNQHPKYLGTSQPHRTVEIVRGHG